MVTAELAVALPVLVVVLAMVLAGVSLGVDQLRCVDAARLGARALARGDTVGQVVSVAGAAAPDDAAVVASGGTAAGDEVVVAVTVRRSVPVLGWGVTLSARSVAVREDGGE